MSEEKPISLIPNQSAVQVWLRVSARRKRDEKEKGERGNKQAKLTEEGVGGGPVDTSGRREEVGTPRTDLFVGSGLGQ